MTTSPLFHGLDGLMTLSRHEGVDIRPTLLRVLTDLYVQAAAHSSEEQRQFVELTSRLIDQVDDATRAAVRARLAIYPNTPVPVLRKLGLRPEEPTRPIPLAREFPSPAPVTTSTREPSTDLALPTRPPATHAPLRMAASLAMQPKDAAEIHDLFFRANGSERVSILHSLADTPLKAAPRIPTAHTARAIETLEMAAFAADVANFTLELSETLMLPERIAAQVVDDPGGEPLATAMRALDMPGPVFQRVLLFLRQEIGTSVHMVYRLSRLYDRLSERSALIMLAAWRGSNLAAARARYQPSLYDDEQQRARSATSRSATQRGSISLARTGSERSGR